MRPPCPTCGACVLRDWLTDHRYDIDVDSIKVVDDGIDSSSAFACRLCGLETESRGRFSWVDSGNLARSALGLVASETVLAGLLRGTNGDHALPVRNRPIGRPHDFFEYNIDLRPRQGSADRILRAHLRDGG